MQRWRTTLAEYCTRLRTRYHAPSGSQLPARTRHSSHIRMHKKYDTKQSGTLNIKGVVSVLNSHFRYYTLNCVQYILQSPTRDAHQACKCQVPYPTAIRHPPSPMHGAGGEHCWNIARAWPKLGSTILYDGKSSTTVL